MSDQEVYRRVGRGGAGNWYSKQDVENADEAQKADLEAQNPSTAAYPTEASSSSPYTRVGRGGAGNFTTPTEAADAHKHAAERTARAVVTAGAKPRTGLSGRGGAGNWTESAAARAALAEQEDQARRDEVEEKVKLDVEAGLAMPKPAYHQHDRDME